MSTPPVSPERMGDFEIVSELGFGGMGVVYLARHVDTGEEVALKVMHAAQATQDVLRRRFVREARATSALAHPNIIRIRESFTHGALPVIAMEVLRGISLKDHLTQKTTLSVEETAGIFVRVVSAVGAAHALGIVHRDLKPDNIFLMPESPFVKVLDFGIAKLSKDGALAETSALTKTGTMIGTPYYMSPEQAFGEKTIDHRSDMWSLGIILYETLTGTLLTRAALLEEVFVKLVSTEYPRLDEVDPTIPRELADLVVRLLKRDPDKRPKDLREVHETLTRFAPEVNAAAFEAAATPLAFDDPSSTTGSGEKKAPETARPTPAPIKLAPRGIQTAPPASIAQSAEPRTAAGTVIVEGGAARPPTAQASQSAPTGTVIMEPGTKPESPAAKRSVVAVGDAPVRDATIGDATIGGSTMADGASPAPHLAERPASGAAEVASADALASTTPGAVDARGQSTWIWWLAAILVLVCLVVLWSQLR